MIAITQRKPTLRARAVYDFILLAVGRAEGTTAALPDDALEIVMRGEEKEDQVATA